MSYRGSYGDWYGGSGGGGSWRRGRGGGGRGQHRRGGRRYDDYDAGQTWRGGGGGSACLFPDADDSGERQGGRGMGGGGGHPPHLRGRAIGMWYASRSRGKKKHDGEREERDDRQTVGMDVFRERRLSNLLRDIRAGENVKPQPSQSYQSPDRTGAQRTKQYRDAFDDEEMPGGSRDTLPGASSMPDRTRIKSEPVGKPKSAFNESDVDYGGRFASAAVLPVKRPHDNLDEQSSSDSKPVRTAQIDVDELPPESKRTESPLGVFTSGPNSYRLTRDVLRFEPNASQSSPDMFSSTSEDVKVKTDNSVSGDVKVEVDGSVVSDVKLEAESSASGSTSRKVELSGDDIQVITVTESDDSDDDDEDDGEVEILPPEEPEVITLDSDDDDETDLQIISVSNMYRWQQEDSEFVELLKSHNEENRRVNSNPEDAPIQDVNLVRNEALDKQLSAEIISRRGDPKFRKMQKFRQKLPSYNMRKKILEVIAANQVTVISGETGCGKTTQVAQFILDEFIESGNGSLCRVVCTQPRRISAISVAERVSEERNETCGGGSTGYQIRLESKLPRQQGSILFCTTGILLKWLIGDPWLAKTSHVILDEIHERDLQSDFLMIILRDLVLKRPTLKLVLMSATLNANMFSQYFGNCPMLEIPGFTFPVEEYLLEDIIQMTGYTGPKESNYRQKRIYGKDRKKMLEEQEQLEAWVHSLPGKYDQMTRQLLLAMDYKEIDVELAVNLVEFIVRNKDEGAILVFMPGWDTISKMNDMLLKRPLFRNGPFTIIPLHSMLPTVNQRQVFERPPPGVRKIVIATNIAETSITIDDVVYVVDCGKIKMKNFDAENNLATLAPEWVSRANARQRRGRAGRVQPGECYHMYTAYQEAKFEDYQLPEILRTRLEELCLQIKLLKLGKIQPFVSKAMQPPSMEALVHSVRLLLDLNALDYNEDLTPLGYHLAQMPVDPQTGKMLLFGAMFCCLDPILTIAASLSFKDAFHIPMGREKDADEKRLKLSQGSMSDHVMLANAFSGWEKACKRGTDRQYCWDNFLSANTLKMLKNMRGQFAQMLCDMKFLRSKDPKGDDVNMNSDNEKLIKAVICAGLYPNVVKVRKQPKKRRPAICCTSTEGSVKIHPKSVNTQTEHFPSPWLVYHLKMKTVAIYLYDSTMVSAYPLLFFGGRMEFKFDQGHDCIIIDDWIKFKSSKRVGHLVKELRIELDKLLEYKITHPGVTRWDPKEREGALLHAITDLITTDYTSPSQEQQQQQPQQKHKQKPKYRRDRLLHDVSKLI